MDHGPDRRGVGTECIQKDVLFPDRFIQVQEARRLFGERADRLGTLLWEGDTPADAAAADLASLPRARREALIGRALSSLSLLSVVGDGQDIPDSPAGQKDIPESLARLIAGVKKPPFWADLSRAERGGAVFLRSGALGGLVLGCYSLVGAYCSPGGNKPLMMSGRLVEDAPRRLAETGRFVHAVSRPLGMRPWGAGEGFRAAVRVRLMHATVRRLLLESGKWREDAWGAPINQADMSATALLFSYAVGDGLNKLGFTLTLAEREDLLHLWRCTGWVMGVREELLCATEAEARTLWALTQLTQGPPDEDSRALVRALMESGETAARTDDERRRARRMRPMGYALSRVLLGPEYAAGLHFPPDPLAWRLLVPAVRLAVRGSQKWARRLPFGAEVQRRLGDRYWEQTTRRGLSGLAATFPLPEGLGSAAA